MMTSVTLSASRRPVSASNPIVSLGYWKCQISSNFSAFDLTILDTCVDAETKLEDESEAKMAETHRKTNLQPWVPQLLSMMGSWKRELVIERAGDTFPVTALIQPPPGPTGANYFLIFCQIRGLLDGNITMVEGTCRQGLNIALFSQKYLLFVQQLKRCLLQQQESWSLQSPLQMYCRPLYRCNAL